MSEEFVPYRARRVVWYASGGGFMRKGPYKTQLEAWASMAHTPDAQKKFGQVHPPDTNVWPEYVEEGVREHDQNKA